MSSQINNINNQLPLSGIRVIEFTHMVMGPTCGMILADLGAEVIKVEPPGGEKTRRLPGLGIGFFRAFNRNKKSVVLDTKTKEGVDTALELCRSADIVIENFRPGMMENLGLGYKQLSELNPDIIYVSHKGFLSGPYENRLALDEVVQMMGGLAYMTGPEGRPLRAGASVNDIMGGMFGVIGVLSALLERQKTGKGQEIQSSLFENCAFLSSQHVQQFLMSGQVAPPMPSRVSAWSVYDVFTLLNNEQLFIAAVSDKQWCALCDVLGADELKNDPNLTTNDQRVSRRPELLVKLGNILQHISIDSLTPRLEAAGLPYAPINRPDQLLEDRHLLENGTLVPIITETGEQSLTLLLPIVMGNRRLNVVRPLPKAGEHNEEILSALKLSSN